MFSFPEQKVKAELVRPLSDRKELRQNGVTLWLVRI
jgi:hypothetical protein